MSRFSFSAIPAAWIGLVFTILLGALQQINDSGLVNGSGLQLLGFLIAVVPLIGGLVTHLFVVPVATARKAGLSVKVGV